MKRILTLVVFLAVSSAFGQEDAILSNALTYHIDSEVPLLSPSDEMSQEFFEKFAAVSGNAVVTHSRRRAVRVPSNTDLKVGFIITDFFARNAEGVPVRWIGGQTFHPLVAGDNYRLSFRRPGEDSWVVFNTSDVDVAEVGMYRTFYMHVGNEFFDLVDGVKKFWNPGIGGYRIE